MEEIKDNPNADKEPKGSRDAPWWLVIGSLGLMVLIVYGGLRRHYRQQANLKSARQQARDVVEPLLNNEHRFRFIRVGGYTGGGGMFLVAGHVNVQDDPDALKKIVEESKPPRPIYWAVQVNAHAEPTTPDAHQ